MGCRLWGHTESDTTEVTWWQQQQQVRPMGFPGGSDGNESASNAGDLGLIPKFGRSPEKGMVTHSSMDRGA